MSIVSSIDFLPLKWRAKEPRSHAFAEMVENINRVEETPARRFRRELWSNMLSTLYDQRIFGPSSELLRIEFTRGGKFRFK